MKTKNKIRYILIIYFVMSCFEKTTKTPKIVVKKEDSGLFEKITSKIEKAFDTKDRSCKHNIKPICKKNNRKDSKYFAKDEIEYIDACGKKARRKKKHNIFIKKANNKKLDLTKIYIMGAVPSLDNENKIIRLSKGITTFTYRIMGELHNKGEKPITKKDGLYLEMKVFFREPGTYKHIEFRTDKLLVSDLQDFGKEERKIKLPIKPEGGMRLFEFKIFEIPESEHKVGLFLILRDKKEIWSTHYIALHRPAPPPAKEGFFDFLHRPTSTKWWYLTLSLAFIAILLATIAIV
ncbi:MAG: hypothetical protein GY830_08825 [Bacteroidetes bacterium]|nr:hypothetical protein [Bacteroidota bacterium]